MSKYKFGTVIENGMQRKYEYSNSWCIETTTTVERVVITSEKKHIEILLNIVKNFEQPLAILYILVVPRVGENKPGRYQCSHPVSLEEATKFCMRFEEYLETDARHHLWIASASSRGSRQLAVYDKHNVIYVYDDIETISTSLRRKGFKEATVVIPTPHMHFFHNSNDIYEQKILDYWDWLHFPLQPQDE